jgi:hypothetical protein
MTETIFMQATGVEIAAAIAPREYNRLLQLPRDRELEGELLDRAQSARDWYAGHGKPFVASTRVGLTEVSSASILLATGTQLNSIVLAQRLRASESHALVIMAASAGTEVAEEVSRHWSEGRPDEAFFLDRFAVAVTEHLLYWSAAMLCRTAEPAHETLMPHLSPGCGNWDIADQHKLMSLLTGDSTTLGPVQLLPTGALNPQHSVLAAMGVTRRNLANTPDQLCRACDLSPCAFRRVPYAGEALHTMETR